VIVAPSPEIKPLIDLTGPVNVVSAILLFSLVRGIIPSRR
jgi:hypothetical protein